MKAVELGIAGAWTFEPAVFPDSRGAFAAPFQGAPFREALGFDLTVAQTNQSISARGVIRGIHYSDVPPGQAKYVYCPRGGVLDVIVDIRVGSPTFGEHVVVALDAASCRAVYVAEGLGHGFVALEDDSVVSYLCSTPYNPVAERGVSPLDPALALPWPAGIEPILSEKDAQAPTLAAAGAAGLLPTWSDCTEHYAALLSR
ncbi:dTDP-4-dehydrorhamnose 3,5-epimerase family protein [Pseudonocardia sp. GCM10023141]|uniref:dTDP-4-dehydrorhamnose 3,5-epimerase family protein n=1 Tax=Pseudonocardia sp. GCM10023141 TaxID=3252653 RepID=UPI003610C221